jgi:hypothetical protein
VGELHGGGVARVSVVSSPLPPNHTQVWKLSIVDGDLAYISDDFTVDPVIGGPYGGPYGERAELGMSNPTTAVSLDKIFNKGDDLWVGWQIYVRRVSRSARGLSGEHTINWQIVTQLKQVGAMGVPICDAHQQQPLGVVDGGHDHRHRLRLDEVGVGDPHGRVDASSCCTSTSTPTRRSASRSCGATWTGRGSCC